MIRWLFLLLFALTVVLGACQFAPPAFELKEEATLRQAILAQLDIPFKKIDTVVYQMDLLLCGNTTDWELAKIYAPKLQESPYWEQLQNQNRTILLRSPSLEDSIVALNNSLADSIHPYTYYFQNKIKMQITGTIESNQRLILHERYDYREKRYAIDKLCEFKENKWEIHILKINSQ